MELTYKINNQKKQLSRYRTHVHGNQLQISNDNYLTNINILDIFALKQLTLLQCSKLEFGNFISNIEDLRIYRCVLPRIHNLRFNMCYLTHLQVIDCQVTDISYISGLKQLKSLSLFNNQIVSLYSLQQLLNLRILEINNNRILDVTPLAGLNLEELQIQRNFIQNISILEHQQHFSKFNVQQQLPPTPSQINEFRTILSVQVLNDCRTNMQQCCSDLRIKLSRTKTDLIRVLNKSIRHQYYQNSTVLELLQIFIGSGNGDQ
ncbi:Sec7_domain-containing protein [Hexamita inflata]|uniref:Sec7 domain-containing protein n=1 Tax=Hexamita inflata TaxID=28002 RepID=A0AA86Q0F0_9EUKA|nr:Sec7 domain-containing protein [Hexamita inflata]